MARKVICRQVGHIPRTRYFKPSGIPVVELEEIVLKIEEAEAIRLKDLMGLVAGGLCKRDGGFPDNISAYSNGCPAEISRCLN